MKHTKGPWKVIDTHFGETLITSKGGFPIARVTYSGPVKHKQGNARLLASAPEMYELLQDIVKSGSLSKIQSAFVKTEKLLNCLENEDTQWKVNREDSIEALRLFTENSVLAIKFKKKDETTRYMTCTLDPEIISNMISVNKKYILNRIREDGVIHVYDIVEMDWRTVHVNNIERVVVLA